MSNTPYHIRRGLPEGQRQQAAEIYYEAFEQKYQAVMNWKQGVAIIAEAFDPELAIVALCGEEVVGIAGLQYEGRRLMHWTRGLFVREFGYPLGVIKHTAVRLDYRPQVSGQLLMDGLAVAEKMRGHGVGTALLNAVLDFAREKGFDTVRLDVVDTNPRARQLYERLGFAPADTHSHPLLRPIIGFGAYTTMIKAVV